MSGLVGLQKPTTMSMYTKNGLRLGVLQGLHSFWALINGTKVADWDLSPSLHVSEQRHGDYAHHQPPKECLQPPLQGRRPQAVQDLSRSGSRRARGGMYKAELARCSPGPLEQDPLLWRGFG